MKGSMKDKPVPLLALAAALVIPALLPQSAHGMYDPKHGRWLQRDPIGYIDSRNLYEYAISNPAKVIDPNGTDVIGDCGAEDMIKIARIQGYRMAPASGGLVRYWIRGDTKSIQWERWDGRDIVLGMLLSKHTFKLKDGKMRSWIDHIGARLNVVRRALHAPSSSSFLVGQAGEKANLKYWADNHTQSLRWGVSPAEAFLDPWQNPGAYATGCNHWTLIIIAAAWVDTVGSEAVDASLKGLTGSGKGGGAPLAAARGQFMTSRQGDKEGSFWIPGDKGYFRVDATNNTYLGPPGGAGIHIGWHVINVSADYGNRKFLFFAPGMPGETSREDVMDTTNRAWTKPGEWETTVWFPKTGLEVSP